MKKSKAVIFDLDGTLLDTLGDLAASMNQVLAAQGWPPHPDGDYRQLVGDGVRVLVERALPPEYRQAETVDRVLREYRTVYAAGWNIRTRPYDGIPEALAELAERRVPMGVLSNKPDDMTRMCVREFFPGISFGFVAGQRPDRPRKPDPAAAEEAAQALGVPAAETLFIGDSGVDMQTARAAGMRAMGVSWGFRSVAELWENGAQAVIDRPGQVLDWIA